ncbi:NAD(P)-dependent oxidoreductase [Piscinibacter sp. XHJ-5]|uniref:NAD(P)-dependent oxidoreductase n=1 Tax=Piscinibacter sp. XHJ-5 TaxID=3037797 RepID=UPI0024533F81|nr:NAD(P)-dependent oxidoreductase [Piscinibacter sp. XHJ-5]
MKRLRILVTHDAQARRLYYGDAAIARLRALGDVSVNDTGGPLPLPQLVALARDCQVIVSDRQTAAPAAVFEQLPGLAVFMRCAVDIRNVDVAAASAHGVLVTRASAGFATAVAEWVMAAMLDLSRHTSEYVATWRAGAVPTARMGRELRGATLGVLGYGAIGRAVVRLGLAFGMRVCVADPNVQVDDPAVEQLTLDAVLAAADCVVCLVVATPQTENLMNDARFAQMKDGAFFVNASRGELVDEAALLRALDSGRLAGCAMDVGRAPDQMPSRSLAAHPRVVATPHVGGLTPPAVSHQAIETTEQLAAITRGETPRGAVNPEHARRLQTL